MSDSIFEIRCNRCGKCVTACGFLAENGPPGSIVAGPDAADMAFSCMVCGLCTELCPEGLDPASVFLALRAGVSERPQHLSGLARHEAVGASFPFVLYALPKNCDTVFFPGCSLAGTRPETTEACFLALKKHLPDIGVVLDCCIRPSHDMGRTAVFGRRFTALSLRFAQRGIRRVLTACPGCQATLAMNPDLDVSTVYEFFAGHGGPSPEKLTGEICVHDPCATRNSEGLHEAVRHLLCGMGAGLSEMENFRQTSLCCGKGVGADNPDQAGTIGLQAGGRRIFTYCSCCAEVLGADHVLDHLLRPKGGGPFRVYRHPRAYARRLLLKRRLSRMIGR
ncbi:MAG: (Fe-S)-binding protein [Deltaproteobacteria bacterium]|nr:(Fe-S)-binding protein [Deltaproteobacteria bacterium]